MNAALIIASVKLHTTELPPAGKEFLGFLIHGKYYHAAQCVKSKIINKAIGYILSLDTFEQSCVVIKWVLQFIFLEDHKKTIGIDQSLSNMTSVEHKCLNNIKKIYQHEGKCYDQQNLKDILDAAVVSTPDVFTYNSPNMPLA